MHWLQVLEYAKSSYLAPFLSLRSLIQCEADAAEDNLRFLLVLEEPCKALAAATPAQIPTTLPNILNCVRLVWNLSRFYNTPDRITGLLRKVCVMTRVLLRLVLACAQIVRTCVPTGEAVAQAYTVMLCRSTACSWRAHLTSDTLAMLQVSNEIIARCCAVINLGEVFSPNVDAVTFVLQQSIDAGAHWKAMYLSTARAVTLRSSRPWDHDLSPIFAHVDAFVQRCTDLLEVRYLSRKHAIVIVLSVRREQVRR
jgi:dynein heavy chain, axonemal